MNKNALIVLSWVVILLLSACDAPVAASTDPTALSPVATATGDPEPIPLTETPSQQPVEDTTVTVATFDPTENPQATNEVPCDRIAPGSLLDVTIPDDTVLRPGEAFTKIWRLKNDGACVWNTAYAVVWFSGETFGALRQQYLLEAVEPGQEIDLSLDMVAPKTPGQYAGYWMLRNPQGELFGLGPSGDAPFWVRVQVLEAYTATPPPTPLPTATSAVLVQSALTVQLNQLVDLDTGEVEVEGEDDLSITRDEQGLFLVLPANGAHLVVYGEDEPGERACRQMAYDDEPILFSQLPPSVRLCYRTSQSLPGTLWIRDFDPDSGLITLEFITWAVP